MAGFRVDFHTHTSASYDCKLSVKDYLVAAKKAGLSAIAITDHDSVDNNQTALKLAPRYGIQVIPGVEVTAEDGTHILAYFVNQLPKGGTVAEIAKSIRAMGGISALPHPYRSDTGIIYNHEEKGSRTREEVELSIEQMDLIELINWKSEIRGEQPPLEMVQSFNKPVIAGTDAHRSYEIGRAFVEFDIPQTSRITPEIILSATRSIWFHPVSSEALSTHRALKPDFVPPAGATAVAKKLLPKPVASAIHKALVYRADRVIDARAKAKYADILKREPSPKKYNLTK